ncbi:MAG TPA: helix-turn-helix domain-containing protein [Syntrophales bacterium]|nr:helix-turn-helix domain-containing protein [Syntrophales bacterium]
MAATSCRKIEVLMTADRILGVMQDAKEPLSVSELTRLTGLSTDMVFRQIGTMEDLRWVERIGEGYVLGMRLAVVWARRKTQVEAKIEQASRELSELTGGSDEQ